MFLQHTSMDHARVQALRNSHTCSDFGFVTVTLIFPRISPRSHLLLQAGVAFGASQGTACTTPNTDVVTPSFACLQSAFLHR